MTDTENPFTCIPADWQRIDAAPHYSWHAKFRRADCPIIVRRHYAYWTLEDARGTWLRGPKGGLLKFKTFATAAGAALARAEAIANAMVRQ